ncbi:MAG: porphobilinogen synthase, partial [Rickettsiales bacterium]|nr:porphobilinogen synthase [Rickettsiales bacterium]
QDLILPIFVIEGKNVEQKIEHLPGVSRLSIDLVVRQAKLARDLGIPALMLFPVIDQKLKTADGREAFNAKNLMCRAVAAIKKHVQEIGVICDVALDPYTSHGHDGVIDKNGYVLNDATVELLCEQAVVQARAGCDIIAPSDMMDGRVLAIREALDFAGFVDVAIMSYAAKYASNFYGPFRHAVGSVSNLKNSDKKTYQMDFRNGREALREVEQDVIEGADILIIKPALPYLDVLKEVSQNFNLPLIAYQVSGEYAMLKFAAMQGSFDFEKAMMESLIACKRAGATAIITYAAIEVARAIN